jgi:hypothetical protein
VENIFQVIKFAANSRDQRLLAHNVAAQKPAKTANAEPFNTTYAKAVDIDSRQSKLMLKRITEKSPAQPNFFVLNWLYSKMYY